MSCRVYAAAAAAAAAAAYRQRSAVADIGGVGDGYDRSCHDASTSFCAGQSSGLIGSAGTGHCGSLYGYPMAAAYGSYGADGGCGRLYTAAGFIETGDMTAPYVARDMHRTMMAEHRPDLSLCGGSDGFITPLTQSSLSSSSSTALVELKDFVCRGGDRLMQAGETSTTACLPPIPDVVSDRPGAKWPQPPPTPSDRAVKTEASTTAPTITTRSSCLYSDAAKTTVSGVAVCCQDSNSVSARINPAADSTAPTFPGARSGSSSSEKNKTTSSGNQRTNHLTGTHLIQLTRT